MKDQAAKALPIVAGLVIGWMVFHPPEALAPLGAARYLVMVLAGGALLLATVVLTIAAALPRRLTMTPTASPEEPAFRGLVDRYTALGFMPAGPAYTVGMAPAATLVGLVHPTEPVYGTVFRTGTVPPVVSSDFISLLEGERGGLTTSANPRGGTLPGDAGSFRQCLVGATPDQLFAAHCDGVRWLRTRGLRCRAVSAASFESDFTRAVGRQRAIFMANPVASAVKAIWRTASARTVGRGRLAEQPGLDDQVRRLLASPPRA
ncbi:MAG TPA: hypothetical protein VMT19_02120 [Thermoanaerobaculaceae bacterium]|nr:hypothetical protein [Thermoanaerobaculaceae bacterium]